MTSLSPGGEGWGGENGGLVVIPLPLPTEGNFDLVRGQFLSESVDAELPPIVHEMQEGADKMVALIAYPGPALMSPAAYLAYERLVREGSLAVGDLRAAWGLSAQEALDVIQELEGVYLWTQAEGQISPSGFRSDLFHDTGLMRAAAVKPARLGEPWLPN